MAEPEFATISFSVWHKEDYSRKFTMNRTSVKPRPIWEVRDSIGNSVGQGYSTDEAVASFANYLKVAKDGIKKSHLVYECRKDGKLAYRIRVEGEGCHIFDSNGAPVGNQTFDTYKAARAYCVEILS